MTSAEAAKKLKAKFGDLISEPLEFRGEAVSYTHLTLPTTPYV